MNSYFDRVVKPCIREYLEVIPGKKGIGGLFGLALNLLKPGSVCYPNVTVVITTRCSLKCAKCNNLMPMYKEPYHINADEVIADVNTLLKYSDCCMKLSFLGGEPFIYPELHKIIDAFRDHPKVRCVEFVTNATVIPEESLLKKIAGMKNPLISISDYGVKTQKTEELKNKLSEAGIPCNTDKAVSWVDPGGTEKRGKDIKTLEKEYDNCYSSRYCRTLQNGKIYTCSRAASLCDLGFMDDSHDSLDLRKDRTEAEFRKEMRDFLTIAYADACDHCDHAKGIKIPAGEQLNG